MSAHEWKAWKLTAGPSDLSSIPTPLERPEVEPVVIDYPDRAAWTSARASGVGASEVSALLGLNPWRSLRDLWREKTGAKPPADLSRVPAVQRGVRLESSLLSAHAHHARRDVFPWPQCSVIRHPSAPLFATLDGQQRDRSGVRRDLGIVEAKTASRAGDWAAGVPIYYRCQIHTAAYLAGKQWGSVVVLIGDDDLRVIDFATDCRFAEAVVTAVRLFWADVQAGREPIDATLEAARAAAALLDVPAVQAKGQAGAKSVPAGGWSTATNRRRDPIEPAERDEPDVMEVAKIPEADGPPCHYARTWRGFEGVVMVS